MFNLSRIHFSCFQDVVTQVEILSDSRPTSSKSTVGTESSVEPETKKQPVKKVSIEDKENERYSQKLNEV